MCEDTKESEVDPKNGLKNERYNIPVISEGALVKSKDTEIAGSDFL